MQKRQILWASLLALNFCLLGFIVYLNLSQPKIAYIDNQIIFNEFQGKKELEAKLLQRKDMDKGKLDSLGLQISILNSKQGANASDREQLGQLQQLYAQTEAQLQHQVENLSAQYTDEVWSQINQYVNEYGDDNNYDYILGAQGTGSLMYGMKGNDITNHILDYINQKYEGA